MSEVEKIYYNFNNLSDDFTDLPDTLRVRNELDKELQDMMSKSDIFKISDFVTAVAAENEKQGFIYGFNYAVALLTSRKAVQK